MPQRTGGEKHPFDIVDKRIPLLRRSWSFFLWGCLRYNVCLTQINKLQGNEGTRAIFTTGLLCGRGGEMGEEYCIQTLYSFMTICFFSQEGFFFTTIYAPKQMWPCLMLTPYADADQTFVTNIAVSSILNCLFCICVLILLSCRIIWGVPCSCKSDMSSRHSYNCL